MVIGFGIHIDWLVLPKVGLIYLPALISIPLTIFWIIGFINTVNLIDGLDGLAAGVAAIASVAIAMLAFQMGQWESAACMVAMAGSALAFLQYNFNPAKIFMGDTGSMFLGYIIAVVSVLGAMKTSGGRRAVCSPYCPYGADYGYAYGYCPEKTERYSNFCTG